MPDLQCKHFTCASTFNQFTLAPLLYHPTTLRHKRSLCHSTADELHVLPLGCLCSWKTTRSRGLLRCSATFATSCPVSRLALYIAPSSKSVQYMRSLMVEFINMKHKHKYLNKSINTYIHIHPINYQP